MDFQPRGNRGLRPRHGNAIRRPLLIGKDLRVPAIFYSGGVVANVVLRQEGGPKTKKSYICTTSNLPYSMLVLPDI